MVSNIKKIMSIITLALLSGCAAEKSNSQPPVVPEPKIEAPEPAKPKVKVISGDTWQLTVPSSVRTMERDSFLLYKGGDPSEHRFIMLAREEVKNQNASPSATLENYVSDLIPDLKSNQVLVSRKTGVINHNDFINLNIVVDMGGPTLVDVHTWFFIKSDQVYLLTCALQSGDNPVKCSDIADTFVLK